VQHLLGGSGTHRRDHSERVERAHADGEHADVRRPIFQEIAEVGGHLERFKGVCPVERGILVER
jgi:hypothetical protein